MESYTAARGQRWRGAVCTPPVPRDPPLSPVVTRLWTRLGGEGVPGSPTTLHDGLWELPGPFPS